MVTGNEEVANYFADKFLLVLLNFTDLWYIEFLVAQVSINISILLSYIYHYKFFIFPSDIIQFSSLDKQIRKLLLFAYLLS